MVLRIEYIGGDYCGALPIKILKGGTPMKHSSLIHQKRLAVPSYYLVSVSWLYISISSKNNIMKIPGYSWKASLISVLKVSMAFLFQMVTWETQMLLLCLKGGLEDLFVLESNLMICGRRIYFITLLFTSTVNWRHWQFDQQINFLTEEYIRKYFWKCHTQSFIFKKQW